MLQSCSGQKGPQLQDVSIKDHIGAVHDLQQYKDYNALVFLSFGIGCPIVGKLTIDFENLSVKFPKMKFFFIDANIHHTVRDLSVYARDVNLKLPILKDSKQNVSSMLNIKRTGEAIVIDTDTWKSVYHGPVNNRSRGCSFSERTEGSTENYLRNALEAFRQGASIVTPRNDVLGCLITFKKNTQ